MRTRNTIVAKCLILFLTTLCLGLKSQSKDCSQLKGLWYYCIEGADEPIPLNFSGCEWKETGNPMGNHKGTAQYSTAKKKYEITGLTDRDSGPVFLTNTKEYSYLTWISSWTNKRTYIVLTRIKHTGRWYKSVYDNLTATEAK